MGNQPTLIIGCGQVGRHLAGILANEAVTGLVRSSQSESTLREQGISALRCDLDRRVAVELPTENADIYYLAPPPREGTRDTRLRNFLAALEQCGQPRRLVYLGTTGVYGDCAGEWVDETRPIRPKAERALRRADAENQLRQWQRRTNAELVLLRVASIYGPGKLPLQRLRAGRPMIPPRQAPWSNRIHLEDLLQVLLAAMRRGRNGEIYNVSDGQPGNMADYFNAVADWAGLPRPPTIDIDEQARLSAGLRSYLAESRRIDNHKMLKELGIELRYPTLQAGLAACFEDRGGIMASD
ncbi:MAG TPA: SDR family oxidoreductase [Chromatiaceae bacterium]|nr:SDR family oxidoreductase [Chromatiaceae bacterium]